ncbi:glycosyltransferase [Streptococcus agalactiae]|uniref:glycosyltransferase family 4 protein n=1 Tax=Streptococcus agalactiae TaxID=1311 RepID=UPI0002BC6124|nr:glycosyltransferase [Streptococcus agalactiae]AIX04485.1 glycosyl transferases group 1 family protein [Streptococcus agalactiae CNCTC 10/84]EPT54664.1 glycosyl transferase family 1 [Streptococcus agalactiae CCUG 25532]EPT84867.1 glycosyl transferase family 1 [Streptococcus agalactiae BSU247]EPV18981.1 glycosyl transferase family 1 [Streptococcus agalactiae GB00640]EPW97331.1 glycosyl transferase family 1 [Streptococcus agalactiae MRI Z1-048]
MKVLLYLEAEEYLKKSGIGRAIKHQEKALQIAGIDYTTNPADDFDLVHMNTYGIRSWLLMSKAKKTGKKVIMHGHSTEEDFRNSFIGSNLVSPLFKWYLCRFYQKADAIITPTDYSKQLIKAYGIKKPIFVLSNGIDLSRYKRSEKKEAAFRHYFHLSKDDKVVMGAGLYFMRKGVDQFVEVAAKMPDIRFIWFGETNKWVIPRKVRKIVTKQHPSNVTFAGYIKGDVYEGAMSASDAFFFPSREETEGIVVLEALASHQHVVLRDIPVYHGWVTEDSVELATDVDGFVEKLDKVLSGKSDKIKEGYRVAESRSIERIAHELASVYQKVMEL